MENSHRIRTLVVALSAFAVTVCVASQATADPITVTVSRLPLKNETSCRHCLSRTPEQYIADMRRNATKGDVISQYKLGLAQISGQYNQAVSIPEGMDWLTKAMDQHYGAAAFALAKIYDSGQGVPLDHARAAGLYQKASDDGVNDAFSYACAKDTQAQSPPEDWVRALPYCEKAGRKGDLSALYTQGIAYSEGKGVAADIAVAIGKFRLAADQDYLPAIERLAQIYDEGALAPQDYAQSLNWYRQGARLGSVTAISALARQYEQGQGTAVNLPEAARLYDVLTRGKDATAIAWFKAHPAFTPASVERAIVPLAKISHGTILYAVDSGDPRFQTLDLGEYIGLLATSYYPAAAQGDDIEGTSTAECRFAASGDLVDCVLVSENPKAYGFGVALMRAMTRVQSPGNKTEWASRYAGKILRVDIRWQIGN